MKMEIGNMPTYLPTYLPTYRQTLPLSSTFLISNSFLIYFCLANMEKRKRNINTRKMFEVLCTVLHYNLLQLLEQFVESTNSLKKAGKKVLKGSGLTKMIMTPWWGMSTKTSSVTTSYTMGLLGQGKVFCISFFLINLFFEPA